MDKNAAHNAAHPEGVAHLLQNVQISSDQVPVSQTQNTGQHVSQRQHGRQTSVVPQHNGPSFVGEREQQNRMLHDHDRQGSKGISLMDFLKKPAQRQPQPTQFPEAPVLYHNPQHPQHPQNDQHLQHHQHLQHNQHLQYPQRPQNPQSHQSHQSQQNHQSHQNHLPGGRHPTLSRPLQFRPLSAPQPPPIHMFVAQCSYLDQIASLELPQVSISPAELHQHKIFFSKLQGLCENAILEQFPKLQGQFSLMQYGSLQSGFAVKGSDMDAVLSWTVPPSDLVRTLVPRLLEKRILQAGHGARLLSKTRVPILKVCADPTDELQSALLEERKKWEENPAEDAIGGAVPVSTKEAAHGDGATKEATDHIQSDQSEKDEGAEPDLRPVAKVKQSKRNPPTHSMQQGTKTQTVETDKKPKQRNPGPWVRERASGPLDFPKDGVGIQCDISFTKPIGMYNTHLLRCYSICDPRVRDMVLFVKGWAKQRKINSGYHGTLSSYGWVLMVLHFLINIARPPVLPNLQLDFGAAGQQRIVDGYDINFADDETQLLQLAAQGRMTRNQEPLGALLRNFFYYFAQQGNHIVAGGFNWRDSIISIRTRGGLLHKSDKEWTTAQTLMVNGFEVRQRYILAIECPFETDHNVARTVLHNGVVAIRDEFRRVWRVLEEVGYSRLPRESLFAQIREQKSNQRPDKKQNRKSDLQPNHKSEQKPSHKSDQQPSQVPKPVDPKEPTRTSAESTKTDL